VEEICQDISSSW